MTIQEVIDMRFDTLDEAMREYRRIADLGVFPGSGKANYFRWPDNGCYFIVPRAATERQIDAIVEALSGARLVDDIPAPAGG